MLMKVIFTLHALRRMVKRKIVEDEVKDALKRPDKIEKKNGKYYFQKRLKNGTIEVCTQKAETHIKIITLCWL